MLIEDSRIIKQINTNLIRKHMLDNIILSKTQLVELTELSFPTVNKIIEELVIEGEVIDLGLQSSTGGRRARAYKLNSDYAYTLSMFISKEKIIYNIKNVFGEVVIKGIKDGGCDFSIEDLDELIESLLKKYSQIKAIAIGVPGSVKDGIITYIDCYNDLQGFELKNYIEGKYKRHVIVENDMKAVTLGCYKEERQEDSQFATIYLGHNGPGCGIIVNGKVVRGDREFAGEVGFLPMYNENNLQDMALKGLTKDNVLDYLARLVTVVAVIINPSRMVLYENKLFPSPKEIEEACYDYLPRKEVPKIIISAKYERHYLEGLHFLAQELIYPGFY
ncbi:MAG: ROK family protein [Epulopiscium sp.]|nr:ROK family protein [Candidatus Epulonipiscium sp.]